MSTLAVGCQHLQGSLGLRMPPCGLVGCSPCPARAPVVCQRFPHQPFSPQAHPLRGGSGYGLSAWGSCSLHTLNPDSHPGAHIHDATVPGSLTLWPLQESLSWEKGEGTQSVLSSVIPPHQCLLLFPSPPPSRSRSSPPLPPGPSLLPTVEAGSSGQIASDLSSSTTRALPHVLAPGVGGGVQLRGPQLKGSPAPL